MTQAQLERAVCQATGESLCTIRQRGFSLVEMPDREPLMVDWDALDEQRVGLLPAHPRRKSHAA